MLYNRRYFFPFVLLFCLSQFTWAERLAPSLQDQAGLPVIEGAGAEVLYAVEHSNVNPDLSWDSVEYISIRVNDIEASRDYGRLAIEYNHFYSDLDLDFAHVLTPEGKLKSLKDDAVQERTGGAQDFYQDRTQLVFSLPEITPGAILEFQFRRTSKKVVMPGLFNTSFTPYWYQPTVGGNGGRIDPVHHAEFHISSPVKANLVSKRVGPHAPAANQQQPGNEQLRDSWVWKDVPGIPVENMMPVIDEVMSRVRVSTSKDWSQVSDWTWSLVKDKIQPDATVIEVARGLGVSDASDEEKVRAVYAYLHQNIRYVFAHLGRGGYEPHFASEVIQQGYGDCKDQTVLAIALLRQLGVDAYPSLVVTQRNGRPDMELVSLYFDHMIVWIPELSGGMWMDTTGDRTLYPGVSNYLQNQSLLNITRGNAELVTLNDQLVENSAQLDLDYRLDKNGQLTVGANISLSGLYEQNMRGWWANDSSRETALQQFVGKIFPDAKASQIVQAEVHNDTHLGEPMSISAHFEFGQLRESSEAPAEMGASFLQVYRLFGGLASLQSPRDRQSRFVSEITETIRSQISFNAVEHEDYALLQNGTNKNTHYYSLTQTGTAQSAGGYQVNMEYRRRALDLEPEQYGVFYREQEQIADAGFWVVRFLRDQEGEAIEKAIAADSDSFETRVLQLRQHINKGDFDNAMVIATEVVERHNNNGEAWYLLGVVQGYSAMIEQSMDSFARAQALGYTP